MQNVDKASIEQTLENYFDSLRRSDAKTAVGLYTTDGVFVPAGDLTVTGTEQLVPAYENLFKAIQLNVTKKVLEVIVKDDLSFVRTQSSGSVLIHATGASIPAENREFFVLRKEQGDWKIARYMFNQPK
ncbi:YybH family protein [Foetidibacter luteolus]|uniref:YybH family protein n=1 Tax=Foetidibacter luteolus TaxID=2608880 RepID=UPI00129A969B|nr:SgcJ/EcaC family oxidoreductase [Foetidibacter luteolus]